MDTPSPAAAHMRKVRSFVRRPGRATAAQRRALAELLPRYGLDAQLGPLDLRAIFGRDAPRVLDIGFGDGEALVTNALNNPGVDYVGVEVHEPGIGHLLLLLEQAAVGNVRVIARDAAEVVPQLVGDASFDAVDLLFPDPWPKKRHHKRRLVQPPFVAEIARVLKPGGFLHVATDWADYARHTREVLAQSGHLVPAESAAMQNNPLALRPPTKFERRGQRLGHNVVDLYFARE
ncbi:MAG TPA: tRNA (guanosine(46)-N7)-methyltransferase TrmB [Gammaproteobacteria bacterium]|nr:tRNA (guanosine(46)-N7)-methyltransferase TrmB [Gammaproteobacteria bacterium]